MSEDFESLRLRRAAIKELLQKVINMPSQAEVLFKSWPSPEVETDQEISGAWGLLAHFCNDVDLRAKDPDYEKILLRQIEAAMKDL